MDSPRTSILDPMKSKEHARCGGTFILLCYFNNIEIIQKVEEEAGAVDKNKKDLSVGADKPLQNTDSNNTDTPIICENEENIQQEKNAREIAKSTDKGETWDSNNIKKIL